MVVVCLQMPVCHPPTLVALFVYLPTTAGIRFQESEMYASKSSGLPAMDAWVTPPTHRCSRVRTITHTTQLGFAFISRSSTRSCAVLPYQEKKMKADPPFPPLFPAP